LVYRNPAFVRPANVLVVSDNLRIDVFAVSVQQVNRPTAGTAGQPQATAFPTLAARDIITSLKLIDG
jgi:hypothetical protein